MSDTTKKHLRDRQDQRSERKAKMFVKERDRKHEQRTRKYGEG